MDKMIQYAVMKCSNFIGCHCGKAVGPAALFSLSCWLWCHEVPHGSAHENQVRL